MRAGQPPVLLNSKEVDQKKKYFYENMTKIYLKKSYHRRAAGVDQVVEVLQHRVLADHDQEDADHLQQPVEHVEPHRDQVPTFPQNFG